MKTGFFKLLLLTLCSVFLFTACSKKDHAVNPNDSGSNNPNNEEELDPKLVLSQTSIYQFQGDKTIEIAVKTNGYEWDYDLGAASAWISEVDKQKETLKIKIDKNSSESPRKGKITFTLTKNTLLSESIDVLQLGSPGLLQVTFISGRGGMDASPMQMDVQTKNYSYPFSSTSFGSGLGNYIIFNPKENGWQPGKDEGAYFRIDYENNSSFKNKLADDHSFECLVKFDHNYAMPQGYETKFFSTHQAGGTGFLITSNSKNNVIAFLPNIIKSDGNSTWVWTLSDVTPTQSEWYHLVGVWDKSKGKSTIYINGEKRGEQSADGGYKHPSAGSQWIALGGDPAGDKIQNTFKGSLMSPNIYDKPLSKEEVGLLWAFWKEKISE